MKKETYPLLTRMMKELKQLVMEKTEKTMLGRWTRQNCFKKEEKIVYYANMDHCGDCGKLTVK